jgi:predicted Zn-dependent protease
MQIVVRTLDGRAGGGTLLALPTDMTDEIEVDRLDRRRSRGDFGQGRVVAAFLLALVVIAGYSGTRSYDPETEEVQPARITPDQEVALGLQAAPVMARQYGGLLQDPKTQVLVDRLCHTLVTRTTVRDTPYDYDCHVLADRVTIDAFALPGGQVFLTAGLLDKLRTEGQLAAVLVHEIGHVVDRDGAEHMARQRLGEGLTGAAVLAAYDGNNPASRSNVGVGLLIGQLINLRFDPQDEVEADRLAVRLLAEAGYDPRALIEVARTLEENVRFGPPPEFLRTHPDPPDRIGNLETAIRQRFPRGVPAGLAP